MHHSALPLVILLAAQVLLIIIFTYVIEFNIMGRDYDAAILVSGTCGFGTGATPNAMAKYAGCLRPIWPSIKAYLLIPARREACLLTFEQPCNHILYKPTVKQPEKNMFEKLRKYLKTEKKKENIITI